MARPFARPVKIGRANHQKIILNTPVTTSKPIKKIIKITHSNIFIPFSFNFAIGLTSI